MDYNYMDHPNQPPLPGSQYGHQPRQQPHHGMYQQQAPHPRTHHAQQMPYPVNVHSVAPFRPLGMGQSPPPDDCERGYSHREQPIIPDHEVPATLNQSSNQLHRILTGNQPHPGMPAVTVEEVNRQSDRTLVPSNGQHMRVFAPLESISQQPRVPATGAQETKAPTVEPDVNSSAPSQIPQGPGLSNMVLSPTSPDTEPHIQATQLKEPSEDLHGATATHDPQERPRVQSPEPSVLPSRDIEATQAPPSPVASDNRPPPSALYLAPTLPDGLSYQYSIDQSHNIVGVIANKCLEKGVKFGPFKGHLVTNVDNVRDSSTWELCLDGRVVSYISANNNQANWMVHVRCAQNTEEWNLEAVQQYGRIYFVTTQAIQPGSELTVFYSEEYRENCGFARGLADLNYNNGSNSFSCEECQCSCNTAKGLLRHIKTAHKDEETHDFTHEVALIPSETSELVNNSRSLVPKQPRQLVSLATTQRFICTTCGKHFPTQGRLIAHESFHEETEADLTDGEYNCDKCGFECPSETSLAEHMSLHVAAPFGCDECGRCYTQRKYVLRHKREKHSVGLPEKHTKNPTTPRLAPWECDECERSYTTLKILKKHKREKHTTLQIRVPVRKATPLATLQCDECDRRYTKRKYLNFHKRQKHGMAPYVNTKLSTQKSSATLEKLDPAVIEQLMLKMRQDENDSQDANRVIEDSGSDQPVDMLGKRINFYSKPRPLRCTSCPRTFHEQSKLLNHKAVAHGGEGKYKCSFCPKSFQEENKLLLHLQLHTDGRPFKCALCPRAFASQSAHDNHQGEHTGAKPYKCDVCNRGFATPRLVRKHKARSHREGEKRHGCSFCEKKFAERSDLKRHEQRHKGIRPFVCLTCGKGFTSKYSLDTHERVHTGEKPFVCPQCGKKFAYSYHLTEHLLTHMKIQQQQQRDTNASVVQQQ